MKTLASAVVLSMLTAGAASAQATHERIDPAQPNPGTVGAMQKAPSDGIATDSAQVQEQQGRSAAASPGTVGAAPGGDTHSQNPQRQ